MKALVWVEHEGGTIKDATLAAVTAAARLGTVHALVAGKPGEAAEAAQAMGKVAGVEKVLLATDHLDVLTDSDHAIGTTTGDWLIIEFGVALSLQNLVFVSVGNNNPFFVIGGLGPLRLCLGFLTRKRFPSRFR